MIARPRGKLHGLLVRCCAVAALSGCQRTSSPLEPSPRPSSSAQQAAPSQTPPAALAPAVPALQPFRAPLPVWTRDELAPAKRYAGLSAAACSAELAKRALPIRPGRFKAPGLEKPLELTGPLRGVRFELPRTLYGMLDCRLVLLLDDLAEELARFRVGTVLVNNTYRPGATSAAKAAAPKSALQSKAQRGQRRAPAPDAPVSQHARGLAIDITEFRLTDGRVLNVERHWHGKLGTPPCGPESRVAPEDAASVALRDLVCAIARGGYCNHWITPNRDAAHFNHLHCDIEAGAAEIRTY